MENVEFFRVRHAPDELRVALQRHSRPFRGQSVYAGSPVLTGESFAGHCMIASIDRILAEELVNYLDPAQPPRRGNLIE